MKEIKIKNVTYPSIKSLAESYHLPAYRLASRLKQGFNPIQAVEYYQSFDQTAINTRLLKHRMSPLPVEIEGQKFPSISKAAEYYNSNDYTIKQYITGNIGIQELLNRVNNIYPPFYAVIRYQSYGSPEEIIKDYPYLNAQAVKMRYRRGLRGENLIRPLTVKRQHQILKHSNNHLIDT